MKNKEIEELLNTFKELINTYSPDTEPFTIDYDYEIKYSALESLLSYIEQLQTTANKCKQLENNRDKAIEEIDDLLVYNEFSDTTKGFGNVPEQLKFYLSNYDNLEDFRKSLKGGSDDK